MFFSNFPIDPPQLAFLTLAVAAVAFYFSVRLGISGFNLLGRNFGANAVALWLPIAATSLAFLRSDPQAAVSLAFAASVACVLLVPGVALATQPRNARAKGSAKIESAADARPGWPMLLPAGLLALLAGFSSRLTWIHAVAFAAQGFIALMLWSQPRRKMNPSTRVTSMKHSIAIAVGWFVLAIIGAAFATSAVGQMSAQLPRLSTASVSALVLAPALMLPMIGIGVSQASADHLDSLISTCVGCAMLCVCALLPMLMIVHRIWPGAKAGGDGSLPFPMVNWRVDSVLLILVGGALCPISINRWRPRKRDGIALILAYGFYMSVSAALAAR